MLTLALGIAALTTVATWTNAVLFDPWPQVKDVRSLGFIDATVLHGQGYSVHYDDLQYVNRNSRSLSETATFALTNLNLNSADAQPQVINAGTVSSNYFHLLGVKPEFGRLFQPDANDRAYSSHDEVVLSDALWRGRLNADPGLIGRSISINQHPFTVIGIGFRFRAFAISRPTHLRINCSIMVYKLSSASVPACATPPLRPNCTHSRKPWPRRITATGRI